MPKEIKDFQFKSIFASKITKVSNAEMETYTSLAGLEKLKSLMPSNVDLGNNPDLIGIIANAAVAGKRNLNGDSISIETGVKIAKSFVWKLVDLNHKRGLIKGVICNYGFSEYGTNKILTEEDSLKSKDPINISLAILLWKVALNDEFIELLEESTDETSSEYGNLSLSWELLFNNYDIAVGPTEVSDAKIITDENEKDKLKDKLQCNGGSGKIEKDYVYRVISLKGKDDFLIPSGVGIVEQPAGNVKGLYIIDAEEKDTIEKSKTSENLSVSNDTRILYMKIKKIEEITNDLLKTADASVIHEFIEDSIRKANESWKEEKSKLDKTIEEVKANELKAAEAKEKAEKLLKEVNEKLEKLENSVAEKQKQEVFNIRMKNLTEEYDLNNEENKEFRSIIAKEIFELDEESYKSWETKAKVLYKEKSIAYKQEIQKKIDEASKSKEEKKKEESKASVETEEEKQAKEKAAQDALKNAEKTNGGLPNGSKTDAQTMKEKYAKAFAEDQFELVTRKGH